MNNYNIYIYIYMYGFICYWYIISWQLPELIVLVLSRKWQMNIGLQALGSEIRKCDLMWSRFCKAWTENSWKKISLKETWALHDFFIYIASIVNGVDPAMKHFRLSSLYNLNIEDIHPADGSVPIIVASPVFRCAGWPRQTVCLLMLWPLVRRNTQQKQWWLMIASQVFNNATFIKTCSSRSRYDVAAR